MDGEKKKKPYIVAFNRQFLRGDATCRLLFSLRSVAGRGHGCRKSSSKTAVVRNIGNGEEKTKQTHCHCYLQGFSRGRWHQQALVVPFMEAFDVSYRLLRGEWQPWVLIPFRVWEREGGTMDGIEFWLNKTSWETRECNGEKSKHKLIIAASYWPCLRRGWRLQALFLAREWG